MRNPLTIDRFHFYGDIHLKMESISNHILAPANVSCASLRPSLRGPEESGLFRPIHDNSLSNGMPLAARPWSFGHGIFHQGQAA